MNPNNDEMPSGVHELEEEVEEDNGLDGVDEEIPHPVSDDQK